MSPWRDDLITALLGGDDHRRPVPRRVEPHQPPERRPRRLLHAVARACCTPGSRRRRRGCCSQTASLPAGRASRSSTPPVPRPAAALPVRATRHRHRDRRHRRRRVWHTAPRRRDGCRARHRAVPPGAVLRARRWSGGAPALGLARAGVLPVRLSFGRLLPPLLSLTLVTALVAFMFQWLSAFVEWEPSLTLGRVRLSEGRGRRRGHDRVRRRRPPARHEPVLFAPMLSPSAAGGCRSGA